MTLFLSFFCGLLFAVGLGISQMTNPSKVQSFLDITGSWDPSLAFVMGGAIPVVFVAHRALLRRRTTWLGQTPSLPTKTVIDRPLVLGSVLFGVGWGLGGYCPAPAITSLVSGQIPVIVFAVAMIAGMAGYHFLDRLKTQSPTRLAPIPPPPRVPTELLDGDA